MKRSFTKPPPNYVFFTDRDLGRAIPDALRNAGVRVERLEDHFSADAPDTEWFPFVGQQGWLVLTHNKKQGRIKLERDAAMRAGLALFFLIGHLPHDQLATNAVRTISKIIQFRRRNQPPFIAKVYRPAKKEIGKGPGRVTLYLSYDEWQRKLLRGR